MIERIVKLEFQNDKVEEFIQLYKKIHTQIKLQEGCALVQLLQHCEHENIFFTYSVWNSQKNLDTYRFSPFFKNTWTTIKPWFCEKPCAWSLRKIITE